MINYAAVTAIIEHHDSSSKNFFMSQDPVTGRWSIIPWDLDHTLGNGCCQVNSNFVTPAEPGDNTSALMRAILAQPEWRDMYFRRLRTLVNDMLATGRMEALYDARRRPGPVDRDPRLRRLALPRQPDLRARSAPRLFNDIQARRTVFANDARVPGNQPAAPEHRDRRDPALARPAATPPSSWSSTTRTRRRSTSPAGRSPARVSLTVQPGTVILPRSAMTFVSNDPAFRAAYGVTVFVGDRYTGNLAPSATLTLTRPDGSIADPSPTAAPAGRSRPAASRSS